MAKLNEAFWRWFGDSKVVDAEGNPLVVYHGTASDFDQFTVSGEGAFFSTAAVASKYAQFGDITGGNVMPVYLSLQNPLIVNDPGGWSVGANYYDRVRGDLQKKARDGGYDGIIVRAMRGRKNESLYIAFRPEQIKSATGNDGTWDLGDPSIMSNPAKSVPFHTVFKALEEMDSTGDPEWLTAVFQTTNEYQTWKLGSLDPGNMNNYSSDEETIQDYADAGLIGFPPIVVVPSQEGPLKWDIVDGQHRAAAAEQLGVKILAYYPAKSGR